MTGVRNSRKLLKNPNGLLEATQHLRPRGSYDPLPPPGGYPLPAYIRRKFSFAPQLSEISLLSLMPDFASSSLDLGNTADEWDESDESELQQTAFGTPHSLHVQYTPKEVIPKKQRTTPKHTVVEAPTTFYSSSTSRTPIFSPIQPSGPIGMPLKSPSLRRVPGRKALYERAGSNVSNDVSSEHSSVSPYTTPRSSVDFSRAESSEVLSLQESIPSSGPSKLGQADQMNNRLVKRLSEQSPNLFKSFCIIDLQLEGKPIRCTSQDMVPTELRSDECLYLDESSIKKPYELHMIPDRDRKIPTIPIEGGLVNIRDGSVRPSHRFVGQVILANEDSKGNEDFDIWFAIAEEEMEKAGIRRTHPKGTAPTAQAYPTDEKAPEAIESLHRDYFIIGVADKETKEWAITMASPTLLASKELRSPSFFDFNRFAARLNVPERFVCHVTWQIKGLRDRVYLVPMIGPKGLVAWLAFLVDRGLPNLW